jgi:hypothetical protein
MSATTRKRALAVLAVIFCCVGPSAVASAQTQGANQHRKLPPPSLAPDSGAYSNRYFTETIGPSANSTVGCGRCGYRPTLPDSSVLKFSF